MISAKIRYQKAKDGVICLVKKFDKENIECDCVNSKAYPNRRKCNEMCSQFQISEREMGETIDIKLWCTGIEFEKVKPIEQGDHEKCLKY